MAKAKHLQSLNYDGPAADGIREVLSLRMTEMCAFGEKATDWSDPEGVHNMRVASRRLRGALRDFVPHLNMRPLRSSLKDLRKFARTLGRVRDYDVTIARLMKTAEKAPAELADGIRKMTEVRAAGLEEYRLKLTPWVRSDSLDRLQTRFSAALEMAFKPKNEAGSMENAVTYRDVARSAILDRLLQFEGLSKSFYRPLRVKPLHNLRIAAKHLRYAIELFEGCWSVSTATFAHEVALIQSALGDLHDDDIMIEDFGRAASNETPELEFDHKGTAAWLMAHFLTQRTKHFKKALQHWERWEKDKASAALRRIVSTDE